MYTLQLDSYEDLLQLDLAGIAGGVVPAHVKENPHPIWVVCTNGKRDACCAQWGLPFFNALVRLIPGSCFSDPLTWAGIDLQQTQFAFLMAFPMDDLEARMPSSLQILLNGEKFG